jgi:hypothetical protein
MPNATIENFQCTLFYDYDHHRDHILSQLSDDGKITWFQERMKMVFLNPLSILFDRGSAAFQQLESSASGSPSTISLISTSVLMNGIEALGSFLTSDPSSNRGNFFAFIQTYMAAWSVTVNSPRHQNNPRSLAYLLWKAFRNGLTHCFVISGAGVDVVNGIDKYKIEGDALEIDIWKFFADFRLAIDAFFRDVRQNPKKRVIFLKHFHQVYPCP